MWVEGAANGTGVGITIALILSAVGMAAVPFAMKRATNPGFWLVCLLMGLGLATFNYSMAVDLASRFRGAMSGPAAANQLKAGALDSRIRAATAALERLAQLPPTSAAMVAAAKTAADSARVSREDECRRRGPFCREREADERAALSAVATAENNRANTVERERLTKELADATKEKVELGPVPTDVDPAATKIGKLLAKFLDMGDRPDLIVIEWWPSFVALIIEAIGLLLPRIILTATGHVEERPARSWILPRSNQRRVEAESKPPGLGPAPPQSATPKRTGTTGALRQKPTSKIKAAAVGGSDSVRRWFGARVVSRTSSKLKPLETYNLGYVPWCEEQVPAVTPVSFTRFGIVMKSAAPDGCGVVLERTPSKRDFYVGIALVTPPKVAVRNSGLGLLGRGSVTHQERSLLMAGGA
jgi:hypothetical protein